MDDEVKIIAPDSQDGEVKITPPATSAGGFKGAAQQVGRGVLEAVPFVGERAAEKANLPQPTTFTERLTKRAATNLPYALAAGATGVGAVPAALGFVGATGLGQAAEEIGLPKSYQGVAELVGGGIPQLGRDIAGRTMGYIQKPLEDLAKKASKVYEIGPGARAEQGMKYGAGDTPQSSLRNLNKFTEEATSRAGSKTKNVNADWIEKTGDELGTEVKNIFAGKTFNATPQFQQKITDLANKMEGAFGEQGNVAKTILEQNIAGQRTGGSLVSPQFKAEDLRSAITQVNAALSTAKGPQAGMLHDLKDALEDLAQTNLPKDLATKYADWRKKYNAYASIKDANQLGGNAGVTSAGQLNPKGLLEEITRRTGGTAKRNPLFENLAEYGRIMKAKINVPQTGYKAVMGTLTENPLAKALGTVMQPRLRSRLADRAATAQTLLPPTVKATQRESQE